MRTLLLFALPQLLFLCEKKLNCHSVKLDMISHPHVFAVQIVDIGNTLHFVCKRQHVFMSLELIYGSERSYVCMCSDFSFITGTILYNLVFKKGWVFFFPSRCFILKVIRIRNNLVNPPRLREKSEREVACQPCVVMSRQQGEFLVLGGSNSPSRRSIETDPGNPSSPLLF